jgi:hypothetical protein
MRHEVGSLVYIEPILCHKDSLDHLIVYLPRIICEAIDVSVWHRPSGADVSDMGYIQIQGEEETKRRTRDVSFQNGHSKNCASNVLFSTWPYASLTT